MKFKEFLRSATIISKQYNIPLDDVEFEVSMNPEEFDPDDGIRYFGDVDELVINHDTIMMSSTGKRNH